jgi:hypothetical protein
VCGAHGIFDTQKLAVICVRRKQFSGACDDDRGGGVG